MEDTAGTGLPDGLMVKVWVFDVPPPGVGLSTVTEAVPAIVMSVAGMDAAIWVGDIYVVVRFALFHCTTERLTKLLPVTVRVRVPPPAAAPEGLRRVMAGTGFAVTASMVKLCAFEVPPPGVGLSTVTEAVPAIVMSAAGMDAAIWVGDT